jgi:hypothetical protein
MRRISFIAAVSLLFVNSGCGRAEVPAIRTSSPPAAMAEELTSVANKRIFFGHQSVGTNIIDGIRGIIASTGPKLTIITSTDPGSFSGAGFFEAPIGRNGDLESKNEAFARILDKGLGAQGGIALYKYCYVDFTASTNIQQVFARYRQNIDLLKAKYPRLKIVHVTVPLTTVEPAGKAWLKAVLGRATAPNANTQRNAFNRMLRDTYRGDPIFDLAEVESTHPDGSRSFFTSGKETIYSLCPEYTSDGGHLNEVGRRRAAERLICLLAQV